MKETTERKLVKGMSNHPDLNEEMTATPEAGSHGVPAHKSDASQISRPGENPELGNVRSVKLNPSQRRAHGLNVRSGMGEANK